MKVDPQMIDLIQSNPILLSALYDINLLPEQIDTAKQEVMLRYFCSGFALSLSLNEP
jgi:hypothetical protein